jgi:hypothetical protein
MIEQLDSECWRLRLSALHTDQSDAQLLPASQSQRDIASRSADVILAGPSEDVDDRIDGAGVRTSLDNGTCRGACDRWARIAQQRAELFPVSVEIKPTDRLGGSASDLRSRVVKKLRSERRVVLRSAFSEASQRDRMLTDAFAVEAGEVDTRATTFVLRHRADRPSGVEEKRNGGRGRVVCRTNQLERSFSRERREPAVQQRPEQCRVAALRLERYSSHNKRREGIVLPQRGIERVRGGTAGNNEPRRSVPHVQITVIERDDQPGICGSRRDVLKQSRSSHRRTRSQGHNLFDQREESYKLPFVDLADRLHGYLSRALTHLRHPVREPE